METSIAIILGFILDLIFGDPYHLPHPICFIGNLISKTQKILLKIKVKQEKHKIWTGFLLALIVCTVSFIIPFFILFVAKKINFYLYFALEVLFFYQIFATKSLKVESTKVYTAVKSGDLGESRKYLSYIVGRDTMDLSETQITKATVETIAENTTDGIISPLFFMILGGAPLAFFYKAVNTLDSMVGYKNDKYLYFGRFSARLDDVLNFIPAIFTAKMMIISAFFMKLHWKNGIKIYKRDKYKHKSPNSGKTESVCAGALGVALGGNSVYFGKLVEKASLGDAIREITPEDIVLTNKIMYVTSIISVGFISLLGILVGIIF